MQSSSKRGREEASPFAAHFEIVEGLTKTHADAFHAAWRATEQLFTSPSGLSLASLLQPDCLPLFHGVAQQAARALLPPSYVKDGTPMVEPLRVCHVHLVANDGNTLIVRAATSSSTAAGGSDDASFAQVQVPPTMGERVVSGDVVLLRTGNHPILSFITFNTSIFTDPDAWKSAVLDNILRAMQWLSTMLHQPPGLPQLTFMYAASQKDCVNADHSGWLRMLQLPMLLHVRHELRGMLDARTVERLRRVSLSMARTLVHVLRCAPTIMPLPHLLVMMLSSFLTSPLFTEAFSTMMLQSAAILVPSASTAAVRALTEIIHLSLEQLCYPRHNATLTAHIKSSCEGALQLVLHRLCKTWRESPRATTSASSSSAITAVELLESFASAGGLQAVVLWLQVREREVGTSSSSTDAWFSARLGRCPTLAEMLQLEHLEESAVGSLLERMRSTYTPYRSKDVLRFVESAAMAAYAELYGPVARAVKHLTDEGAKGRSIADVFTHWSSATSTSAAAHRGGLAWGRVAAAHQVGLRRHTLAAYDVDELLHGAEYGLPVQVELFEEPETTHMSGMMKLRKGGTVFGYVLVRLQGRMTIFPVLLSCWDAASSRATLFGIKDRDLLPDFVQASAAMEESGVADAWLIVGRPEMESHATGGEAEMMMSWIDPRAANPPRLLPRGTDAATYLHFMHRVAELRSAILRTTSTSSSSSSSSIGPSSLWLSYLGSDVLPMHHHAKSLAPTAANLLRGAGGRTSAQHLLKAILDAAPFTQAQQEALHVLCGGEEWSPASSAAGRGAVSGGATCNIRLVEGSAGSGKSAVIIAGGMGKGRLLREVRKEHQLSSTPPIKEATSGLKKLLASAMDVRRVEELYTEASASMAEDGGASSNMVERRDVPEELATHTAELCAHYTRLSEGLNVGATPLLLRHGATQAVPPHLQKLLFSMHANDDGGGDDDGGAGEEEEKVVAPENLESLHDVLTQSAKRSLKSPMAVLLTEQLQHCHQLSAALRRLMAEAEGGDVVWSALLPLIMSGREVASTATAAAEQHTSWAASLDSMWPAHQLMHQLPSHNNTNDEDNDGEDDDGLWVSTGTSSHSGFAPVEVRTSLHTMSADQAAKWHAAFASQQRSALHLLHHWLEHAVVEAMRHMEDVVFGLAAVSQTTKPLLLTATARDVLHTSSFRLLQRWQPGTLLLDDVDGLPDGVLLALPQANTVSATRWSEAPPYVERCRRAASVLLRDLRREMHNTSSLATTTLRETMRCSSAALRDALRHLCRADRPFGGGGSADSASTLAVEDGTTTTTTTTAEAMMMEAGEPPFSGLVSSSALELWTHAVPLTSVVEADGVAASFLASVAAPHNNNNNNKTWTVYAMCHEDARVLREVCIREGQSLAIHVEPLLDGGISSSQHVSAEEESETVVVCLSGLAAQVGLRVGDGPSHRMAGWMQAQGSDEESTFTQRLQCWLWRLLSRARRRAVVVGSHELITSLGLLTRMELFINERRRASSSSHYWLPDAAGSATLALCCPNHHTCKRTASIVWQAATNTCAVKTLGATRCQSLCLGTYSHCQHPSHACLHVCHVREDEDHDHDHGGGGGGDGSSSLHHHCPYPCPLIRSCGHACDRQCGDACEPCEVIEWRQLLCGQRVISGMNGATMEYMYETWPHYQQCLCGEEPQPCQEPVVVVCGRCGGRTWMRCSTLTQHNQRLAMKAEGEGRDGGHAPTFAIRAMECAGCVGIFNVVAAKYGVEVLALPPHDQCAEGDSENHQHDDDDDDDDDDALALPRHLLPDAAQVELDAKTNFARKKADLLAKKEALELSNGLSTSATSDYATFKAKTMEMQARQQEQEESRRAMLQHRLDEVAADLQEKLSRQIALSEELDSAVPLLLSEAEREAERQRSFAYATGAKQ